MTMLLGSEAAAMQAYRVSRAVNTPGKNTEQLLQPVGRANASRRLPFPAEGRLDVQLGQPVRPYRLPIGLDLGHILAQPSLVAGHPHLGAGTPLLVAGTPAEWPTWAMPVPVEIGNPDPVAHPLRQRNHPRAAAGDDRRWLAGEAGRTRRPVEVGGQRHGAEDTADRRKGCDRGAGAGVSICGGGDADGPVTRDKVQFFR